MKVISGNETKERREGNGLIGDAGGEIVMRVIFLLSTYMHERPLVKYSLYELFHKVYTADPRYLDFGYLE